jgi:hypothetical protein
VTVDNRSLVLASESDTLYVVKKSSVFSVGYYRSTSMIYFFIGCHYEPTPKIVFLKISLDLGPSDPDLGPPLLLSSSSGQKEVIVMPRGQLAASVVAVVAPEGGCRHATTTLQIHEVAIMAKRGRPLPVWSSMGEVVGVVVVRLGLHRDRWVRSPGATHLRGREGCGGTYPWPRIWAWRGQQCRAARKWWWWRSCCLCPASVALPRTALHEVWPPRRQCRKAGQCALHVCDVVVPASPCA